MEGVKFENDNNNQSLQQVPKPAAKSWAVKWVMKLSGGLIKNESQASYVLFAIIIIFIIISIYNFNSSAGVKSKAIPASELPHLGKQK